MPLGGPEDRYRSDAQFRTMVDYLEVVISHAKLTPAELREAVMLACIHHELRVTRVVYIQTPDGRIERVRELGDPFGEGRS